MGKQQRAHKKLQQITFENSATKETEFKHGPYYRGGGSTFLSDEIIRREYTPELSDGQVLILLILNRYAWEGRNLVVEAAASFLALQFRPIQDPENLPRDKKGKRKVPGERTVERHLTALIRMGYLRLERHSNERDGNRYFVEPVFIWSSKWHELKGIEVAHCIRSGESDFPNVWLEKWYRQNGGTRVGTAKMAVQYRQNGGTGAASLGRRYRQIGGDLRSRSSDPIGAQRHSKNATAGGVPGRRSEDEVLEQKGVGLPADSITTPPFNVASLPLAEIGGYCAKMRALAKVWLNREISKEVYEKRMNELNEEYGQETFFAERAETEKKKRPVGSRSKSKFHAQV